MTDGKRPSGLTALAVLNLIGAVLCCLAFFGLVFTLAVAKGMVTLPEELREQQAEATRAFEQTGMALIVVEMAFEVLFAFLLAASGIGYLKQSRFWGRALGNVWAILSIAYKIAQILLAAAAVGGSFMLLAVPFFVYPVLTLILLNTTFKEDFVR